MTRILEMAEAATNPAVGGKARTLAKLAQAGFPVPEFFVILPHAFGDEAAEPAKTQDFDTAIARLGAAELAVRSSGSAEDGTTDSYAGQYLSILEVRPEDVGVAAIQVWRSGYSDEVTRYRRARGRVNGADGPAVIVQSMIQASTSGIAFTADPVTGDPNKILVSATAGLGDKLACGIETGETEMLERNAVLAGESPASNARAWDQNHSRQAAHLALRVEDFLGKPQDIEWCHDGTKLWLLQARPITTLPPETPGILDDFLFDNSNIVESYPGVVSPLTFSFARYVYARVYRSLLLLLGVAESSVRAHDTELANLLGRIDGRIYYNLLNWYGILALLPGFANNRRHMELMMGVKRPLPDDLIAKIAGRSRASQKTGFFRRTVDGARLARIGVTLAWRALSIRGRIRRFHCRLESALDRAPASGDASLEGLIAEYRTLEKQLLDRWDAPLVNDLVCMMAFGGSRAALVRWAGDKGAELHNEMLIGQGNIVSAEPARRIREMAAIATADPALVKRLSDGEIDALAAAPRLKRKIDDYLDRFGDRCIEELKLESIPLTEDPVPLLKAVAAAAMRPDTSVPAEIDLQSGLRELLPGRPVRRFVASRLLHWARARVRDRENLRFERTRVFGRVRRVFMSMGRAMVAVNRLDDPRDVLFLTVDELLSAATRSGCTQDLRGLVALRRSEQQRFADLPDPPERLLVDRSGREGWRDAYPDDAEPAHAEDPSRRFGTGASRGIVRGIARVVEQPGRDQFEAGEILVARSTDPGWIALFASAAGIVVERGSLLSHSAIVAREMGIPCVVGLPDARQWICTGDCIEIDGTSGHVRRLEHI